MLKLYKNKFQTFECAVEIEGADISEARSRIILYPKNDTRNILYNGIVKDYRCIVNINSNVNVGKTGVVVLEVLVDDSLIFTPWEDVYEIVDKVKVLEANLYEQEANRPRVVVKDIEDTPEIKVMDETIVKIASKLGKAIPRTKKSGVKVTLPLKKEATVKISEQEEPAPVEIIDPPSGKDKNVVKKDTKIVEKISSKKEKTELEKFIEEHGDINNINVFDLPKS